jgi:hypothetical protein
MISRLISWGFGWFRRDSCGFNNNGNLYLLDLDFSRLTTGKYQRQHYQSSKYNKLLPRKNHIVLLNNATGAA